MLTGFVCYAHADAAIVDPFLELMADRMGGLRGRRVDAWWDRRILVGECWDDAIRAVLEGCDVGIVCVTPALLVRPYIRDVELPRLLASGRIVIPVGLRPVLMDLADLRGIEQLQVFTHRPRGAAEGRCFSQTRGAGRDVFCNELVRAIVARVERDLPQAS